MDQRHLAGLGNRRHDRRQLPEEGCHRDRVADMPAGLTRRQNLIGFPTAKVDADLFSHLTTGSDHGRLTGFDPPPGRAQ